MEETDLGDEQDGKKGKRDCEERKNKRQDKYQKVQRLLLEQVASMWNQDPNCIETVMTMYGMGYRTGMLEVELVDLDGEKNAHEIVNSDVWSESLQKPCMGVFLWCFLFRAPFWGGGTGDEGSGQDLML